MRIRMTLTLLCLLVPMVVGGCGTSKPAIPNVLLISYYKGFTTIPVYQWTVTSSTEVQAIYTHILALPKLTRTFKSFIPFRLFVFKQDGKVLMTATIGPTGEDGVQINGNRKDARQPDDMLAFLMEQVFCAQTPGTVYCLNPTETPTS